MGKEKRRFRRYHNEMDFSLQIGEREYAAHMRDYSVDGLCVFIKGFPPLKSGDAVNLNIQIISLKSPARVVRVSRLDEGLKVGLQRVGILHGTIHDFPLADVLLGLQRSDKTGSLYVKSGATQKCIHFDAGDMVFATSNMHEDRLGDMLLREGRLTRPQYDESSAILRQSGKRHGAVLVEMGILKPKELFGAVNRSVEGIILSMFNLREGEFMFREGPLQSQEMITLKLSAANLIYKGIKGIEDVALVKSMCPHGEKVLFFSSDPLDLFQAIDLGDFDKGIIKLVDGSRSYKEVVSAACDTERREPFEAMRTLNALLATRIIETEDEHTEEAKTAPGEHPGESAETTAEEVIAAADNRASRAGDEAARIDKLFAEHLSMGYYKVLGLPENASTTDIKRAYYRMAREFHPDRHFDLPVEMKNKLNTVFSYITAAYSTLSSPSLRAEYDKGPKTHAMGNRNIDPFVVAAEKFMVGQAMAKKGRHEEAARFFAEAAYLNPEDSKYHFHQAVSQSAMGKHREAERTLQRAIKLDPFNADYAAEEGHIFLALGFPKRAKASFDKSLKLKPLNQRAMEGVQKLPKEE